MKKQLLSISAFMAFATGMVLGQSTSDIKEWDMVLPDIPDDVDSVYYREELEIWGIPVITQSAIANDYDGQGRLISYHSESYLEFFGVVELSEETTSNTIQGDSSALELLLTGTVTDLEGIETTESGSGRTVEHYRSDGQIDKVTYWGQDSITLQLIHVGTQQFFYNDEGVRIGYETHELDEEGNGWFLSDSRTVIYEDGKVVRDSVFADGEFGVEPVFYQVGVYSYDGDKVDEILISDETGELGKHIAIHDGDALVGLELYSGNSTDGFVRTGDAKFLYKAVAVGIHPTVQTMKFEVYPNPVIDRVEVPAGLQEIEVLNASGQLVPVSVSGTSLEVGNIDAGIYIVRGEKNGEYYAGTFSKN